MVLVSGGFDPYHDGHAELIERAGQHGEVVVALNSDAWLTRKKGAPFMPWEARRRVLQSVRGVVSVYPVNDDDGTVVEALRTLRPDYFANGGDRAAGNTPEVACCQELGIRLLFGLGEKIRSSSALVHGLKIDRGWGTYRVLAEGPDFKVKLLEVRPGCATSLQLHRKRYEHWELLDSGGYRRVDVGAPHRLANSSDLPLRVLELQVGRCEEADIERLAPAVLPN
jgi:cytidyltransferase-like protein